MITYLFYFETNPDKFYYSFDEIIKVKKANGILAKICKIPNL